MVQTLPPARILGDEGVLEGDGRRVGGVPAELVELRGADALARVDDEAAQAVVAALRPDVAVIHAQRADRAGNVQLWGITGVQKEAVLASQRSVVTVEEIVDHLTPQPGAIVLPSWAVSYVARVPGGAHPSYALGHSTRDTDYYVAWTAISRDRDRFRQWLEAAGLGAGT